jgi:hypothetical protein
VTSGSLPYILAIIYKFGQNWYAEDHMVDFIQLKYIQSEALKNKWHHTMSQLPEGVAIFTENMDIDFSNYAIFRIL